MPRIIHPLSEFSEGLFENTPDKSSIEQFKFFHADEGKPQHILAGGLIQGDNAA